MSSQEYLNNPSDIMKVPGNLSKKENSCIISWQEKTKEDKFIDKSFPCPKNHVQWHLNNLRRMPEVIYNPTYRNI